MFMCKTLITLKLNLRRGSFPYLTLPDSLSSPNLKMLQLDMMLVVVDESFIQILIQGCPQLEELYIFFAGASKGNIDVVWDKDDDDEECGYEFPVEAIFPICFIKDLKEIKSKGFNNQDYELKIVEHLLKNGKSLRKVVSCGLLLQPSVCLRIFSFKRCSPHCQIVFHQNVWNTSV
ncbi:OLC1v1022380C1 [Oldenlandia corymbosa var. corymbosa]|uniref:OLC1v1022380C1 n=1 Tax=Oldenlandia corymbosa var. corymbosa TaxID=529605 RepID=A0AAV1C0C3_OLDCO|nr:OLC1v1022380C1 [Oldenlandia corymbosa var. corymbosa]